VPITAEELRSLTRIESDDSSEDETLVDDSEMSLRNLPGKTGRDIDHNKATTRSIQINAAIETDIWKDMDRLSIKHNVAESRAVQINHGTTLQVLAFMRDWQGHNIAASHHKRYDSAPRF
jgi:hypothetical protein